MIFNIMGFGLEPERFQGAKRFAHLGHAFGPSLRAVAEAIGMPIDTVDATGEVARATRDLEIAAGVVRAGTVAAQRAIVTGRRNGEPFLSFTANWFVSTDIDADWDLVMSGGWRVIVDGDCPLDLQLRLTAPPETMAETTPGYTANRAVNVVAAVCAAPPGIVTTDQLPTVVANLGSRPRGLDSSRS